MRPALLVLVAVTAGCKGSPSAPPDAGALTQAVVRANASLDAPFRTFTGRVLFDGPFPAARPIPTSTSVERVCGRSVPDLRLRVDADGGLADVVVWLDVPDQALGVGETRTVTAALDQRGCAFLPPVLAARAGTVLKVRNSDPLTHSVRAEDGSRSLFNVAMPLEHMEIERSLPRTAATLRLHCDIHPWMSSVVRTFGHPYFALTGSDGRFRMEHLPPGPATVRFWHPLLGDRRGQTTLEPGEAPLEVRYGTGR